MNTKAKEVTERFKIGNENQERGNKTANMQDKKNDKKDNRENQKMVTIKELENSKKKQKLLENIRVEKLECLKKIPSVKPFTNIIRIEEENPKWDKDTTKRQDKNSRKAKMNNYRANLSTLSHSKHRQAQKESVHKRHTTPLMTMVFGLRIQLRLGRGAAP